MHRQEISMLFIIIYSIFVLQKVQVESNEFHFSETNRVVSWLLTMKISNLKLTIFFVQSLQHDCYSPVNFLMEINTLAEFFIGKQLSTRYFSRRKFFSTQHESPLYTVSLTRYCSSCMMSHEYR